MRLNSPPTREKFCSDSLHFSGRRGFGIAIAMLLALFQLITLWSKSKESGGANSWPTAVLRRARHLRAVGTQLFACHGCAEAGVPFVISTILYSDSSSFK